MKKLILVVIFVTQLGSAVFASAEVTNSGVLTEANKESFQNFIEKQAPMFYQVNTDNWKTFQHVVALYGNSKSDLLKMNKKEKRNFLLSSDQLVKELRVMNSQGSEKWINQIISTTAIIKFTWQVLEEKTDVQFEQAPEIPEMSKMDLNFIGR